MGEGGSKQATGAAAAMTTTAALRAAARTPPPTLVFGSSRSHSGQRAGSIRPSAPWKRRLQLRHYVRASSGTHSRSWAAGRPADARSNEQTRTGNSYRGLSLFSRLAFLSSMSPLRRAHSLLALFLALTASGERTDGRTDGRWGTYARSEGGESLERACGRDDGEHCAYVRVRPSVRPSEMVRI